MKKLKPIIQYHTQSNSIERTIKNANNQQKKTKYVYNVQSREYINGRLCHITLHML